MEYVEHPWLNERVIEKRTYQENIVKTALTGNTLVVLPTGMGKTSIAALVAANRLEKDMNKKILFMAPTKPLVEQHRKTFEQLFKIGPELQVVTGQKKPEERWHLYDKADIIFSTPQTIRNDVRKGRLDLRNFSLLIFDEAHRCVGDYAYVYVAKKYKQGIENEKDCLILALTASPASEKYKINEIKNRLFISNVEIRTRDDEDVRPYLQRLTQEWKTVELTSELKKVKGFLEKCKEENINKLLAWNVIQSRMVTKKQILQLQQRLAKGRKTGFDYAAMSSLAELLKIDHALTLLETQCLYALNKYFDQLQSDAKNRKTRAALRLVKNESFNKAMAMTNDLIERGKEHPKMEKLREIIINEFQKNKDAKIIVFAQFRNTIDMIKNVLKQLSCTKPIEFIGQTKKGGKGLSQREQVKILNEFKLGIHNVLIASQIGEEGLDVTETDIVIFYEGVPSAVRKIQRTGRTARTRPGKVIILITKGTRDEAYFWSGHHKEKKMKRILYDMQKGQKDLMDFKNH